MTQSIKTQLVTYILVNGLGLGALGTFTGGSANVLQGADVVVLWVVQTFCKGQMWLSYGLLELKAEGTLFLKL